jgi:hypothetical protein
MFSAFIGGSGIGSSGFFYGWGLDVAPDWIVMITNNKGAWVACYLLWRVLIVVCIVCRLHSMYVNDTLI